MDFRKTFTTIGGLCALLTVPYAGGQTGRTVTVTIVRVAQKDNLDKMDQLGSDKADFYSLVQIGQGPLIKSKNMSDDDGRPNWKFTGSSNGRYVGIRIKLNDDDGGVEEQDDFVDINPKNGKKDLNFTLDTRTGRISGDVQGRRGQVIRSDGQHDSDRGRIWFVVR